MAAPTKYRVFPRGLSVADDRRTPPPDVQAAFDRAADAHQDALQALRDQIHSL